MCDWAEKPFADYRKANNILQQKSRILRIAKVLKAKYNKFMVTYNKYKEVLDCQTEMETGTNNIASFDINRCPDTIKVKRNKTCFLKIKFLNYV